MKFMSENEFVNGFMAPEVLKFKNFTEKSDVWSVGMLAIYLAERKLAYSVWK